MADYYTHFCIALEKLGAEKLEYWRQYDGHKDDDGQDCHCFDVRVEAKGKSVVLDDDGGNVTMDHVAAVLRSYLRTFRIREPVTVPYANTCSSSRTEAFDGGVVVVWAQKEVWLNATAAGEQIAAGEDIKPNVFDYATPLDELNESTES